MRTVSVRAQSGDPRIDGPEADTLTDTTSKSLGSSDIGTA